MGDHSEVGPAIAIEIGGHGAIRIPSDLPSLRLAVSASAGPAQNRDTRSIGCAAGVRTFCEADRGVIDVIAVEIGSRSGKDCAQVTGGIKVLVEQRLQYERSVAVVNEEVEVVVERAMRAN